MFENSIRAKSPVNTVCNALAHCYCDPLKIFDKSVKKKTSLTAFPAPCLSWKAFFRLIKEFQTIVNILSVVIILW